MTTRLKKIFKFTARFLIGLFALFFIAWLLIQEPKVQTWLVQKITQNLSENLQTKATVERVNIRFFKTLLLENIYIEDRQQDTLLFAKELSANIGLFSLFQNEIYLNDIGLKSAKINLLQPKTDTVFNFQFLIDAFSSDEPKSGTPWKFGLGKLHIQNTQFTLKNESVGIHLNTQLDDFLINVETLDLQNEILDLEDVELKNSLVSLGTTQVSDTFEVSDTSILTFPEIPWKIKVQNLDFDNNSFIFKTVQAEYLEEDSAAFVPTTAESSSRDSARTGMQVSDTFEVSDTFAKISDTYVNYSDLNLSKINLQIRDFDWAGKQIIGRIKTLSFKEKSGFQLDDLKLNLEADSTKIILQAGHLKTPESQLNLNAQLNYSEFNDLTDFVKKVNLKGKIEDTEIALFDLKKLIPNFPFEPSLSKTTRRQASDKIQINGQLSGTIDQLNAKNLDIKIGRSLSLKTDFSSQNLTDFERLIFDLNLKKLVTSEAGLKKILTALSASRGTALTSVIHGLKPFGKIQLSGKAKGNISDFRVQTLALKTAANTQFKINGNIKNVLNPDRMFLDLRIDNLETKADDLRGFSKNDLPPMLDSLGNIQYVGNFKGTTRKFELYGNLTTQIGILNSNLGLDFNPDYSNAKYGGQLELRDFDLGKFLGDKTELGKVNFKAKGKGQGFEIDSLKTDIQSVITNFEFKKHPYENLIIEGKIDRKRFFGKLQMNDHSTKFNFNGEANLNGDLPEFHCVLNVDTIDLQHANLFPKPLALSGKTTVNLTGDHPDNLVGTVEVSNLNLSNDSVHFHSDYLTLLATENSPTDKTLDLKSDFLTAKISGDYQLSELPDLVVRFLSEYANWVSPKKTNVRAESSSRDSARTDELSDQKFQFHLNLLDHHPLSVIWLPQLTDLKKGNLTMRFDSRRNFLDLDGRLDSLVFGSQKFDNIELRADGDAQKINSKISLNEWEAGAYFFEKTTLDAGLFNDSLNLNLSISDSLAAQKLNLLGNLTKVNSKYEFRFDKSFILNEDEWKIEPKNQLTLTHNHLFVNHLTLKRKEQIISLQSIGTKVSDTFEVSDTSQLSPLKINFENFKISEIATLLDRPDNFVEGALNGEVILKDFFKNLHYNTDLKISDLTLREQLVGDFSVQAKQGLNSDKIDVLADLKGEKNRFHADGNYQIQSRNFDVTSNIETLELKLLDPFLEGLIGESSGNIHGNFKLSGTPDLPKLKGEIGFNEVSTLIDFTKTRYKISEGKIPFDEKEIRLQNLILTDEKDRKAKTSGRIKHDFFSDLNLDLKVETDEFQFLNTTVTDNELFYGKLFLDADLTVVGAPDKPRVEVIAKTLSPSVFYLSPFAESEAIVEDDYIIFANPDTYFQENPEGKIYETKSPFPFDVSLNLSLTDAAELQFIIDPLSGDKLVCRGNSDLLINMTPSGVIEMYGTYVVESGHYNFSYSNLVKRKFDIEKGGTVAFNGDPLNARFNVTAIYETRATTYELIKNEATLNTSEIREAQRRTPVEVLLKLSGELSAPELEFDIELPDNQASAVSSTVTRKLESLRANPNDLNQQVFGLILVNSFVLAESSSNVLAGAGESTALSSVSKLFSNQLNRLADRYIKGVEVNVDIDSYKSQYANGETANRITEVGIGVSKQLFNDRLTVSVGGNLDVEGTNSNATNFAGDFLLEYKLTDDGNYLLRAFRKSNYDVLLEENSVKNGVSLFFRKGFERRRK